MNGSEDDYFVWPDNSLPNIEKKIDDSDSSSDSDDSDSIVVKVKLKNKLVLKYLILYY